MEYGNIFKSLTSAIVFFSQNGHTRQLARILQEETSSDLFEIVSCTRYPSNYQAMIEYAKREINGFFCPEIETKFQDPSIYSVIFVGSPNWWFDVAPPLATFLSTTDLSGKIIIPFITHGGGTIGRCETKIREMCPNSEVHESLYLPGIFSKLSRTQVQHFLCQTAKKLA
ncbi:MAG: flavodoxin [Planctomycetia bacterium]|nr:flavodoxin [Planctomycetia bacterium]